MSERRKEYVQGEEGEDVSPDAGRLSRGVVTEGLERGQNYKDGRPAVVERERKVDEHLVRSALGLVVLLDDVVDVRHRGADEEREDECYGSKECKRLVVPARRRMQLTDDVILGRPERNVDGVQHGEQGETPGDALNDRAVPVFGELVDDGS